MRLVSPIDAFEKDPTASRGWRGRRYPSGSRVKGQGNQLCRMAESVSVIVLRLDSVKGALPCRLYSKS